MEDDDEFGDLYTDVLKPFESQAAPQPPHLSRPIDLNLESDEQDSFYGAPLSDQKPSNETIPNDSVMGDGREDNSTPRSRVSENHDQKLPNKALKDASYGGISDGWDDKDMKFDIEEGDTDCDPIIPGLSISGPAADPETLEVKIETEKDSDRTMGGLGEGGEGEGDHWDSDSEDDLQIVLNDNNRCGTIGADRGKNNDDDDDDDDDEDPLVIVTDINSNQAMEEQQWGEDAVQAAEGERKDTGEAGKGSGGGAAAVPKIGYSSHGYHPFHSQYKYVRPGAAPMHGGTAAGPGAASSQVRPPVNMVPMAGRSRGEWRPPGMKTVASTQKGFGMPWGSNTAGRVFGVGLDFTLPSHKTIFEVDIDGFEEKPWRYPGVDITDFFNFSLNEESWKEYCKQLEQHRMETSMQGRIRVYESGRMDQGYDPDLPPELAAATGIQSVSADNPNLGKPDDGPRDLTNGLAPTRQPLPTGRPIPVDPGSGERLPSIDTRAPRIRDADAIIEIVCEDALVDESSTGNVVDRVDNNHPGDSLPGETGHVNGGKARDISPHPTPTPSDPDKEHFEEEEEDLTESADGRHTAPSSSPAGDKDVRSSSLDLKDAGTDSSRGSMMEEEEHKVISRGEQLALQEHDGGGSKAERSSESSKARSGSHRDHYKFRDGMEEEVIQDRRDGREAGNRKQRDTKEQHHRKRNHGRGQEVEKTPMAIKGSRENAYPHGNFSSHHSYVNNEDFDRKKEHDIVDGAWRRRDGDLYSRQGGDEDSRKRNHGEDMGSRYRGKTRETEKRSKDEHLHFRKQLDDGTSRVHKDKDVGSRHKEKDDNLRSSCEMVDGYYKKRRRDEEYPRRGRSDKNEILHSQRESVSRPRREDRLDQQQRDVQHKIRDNVDDHVSLRHRDEIYLQRDGSERLKDRKEWDNHEEIVSARDIERQAVRDQRGSEDRGISMAKDEYKASDKDYLVKDTTRHGKQQKRRDHRNEGSSLHNSVHEDVSARSKQLVKNEENTWWERSGTQNDQAVDAVDNKKLQERRHRESKRKNKESESGDVTNLGLSRSKQEVRDVTINEMAWKSSRGAGNEKNDDPVQLNSVRKHKEASQDERQQDSRRGRSKLERWTSHKERDYSNTTKSHVSLKFQEMTKNSNDESTETSKAADCSIGNQQLPEKAGSKKDAAQKPSGDQHLDTFEKLKKRSERFKLPMPNEKEASAIKKVETEALPSANNDTPVDLEVKPERPARKRRWTGS